METEPGGSILIVDDDAGSLDALAEILSREGFTVATAASGREAIERARNLPNLCLIILDLLIPDGDGRQLLAHRRNDPALARVPVIVMSGLDERVNADAQVRKPIDVAHLLKLVRLMAIPESGAGRPGL